MGARSAAARRLVGALLALLGVALVAPGGAAEDAAASGAELERLRRAIAERRDRVEAYERREESLFDALEALDRAERVAREELARAEREAREAARERQRLEKRRGPLEARLARTRESLAERAVALYKAGALGPIPVLFAPGSLRERLARLQGLRRLVAHDERLLARHRAEERALARAVAEAAAAEARLREARAERAQRLEELAEERRVRRTLLVEVRRDRARERAVLNELEEAARELERTLRELEASPRPAPQGRAFAALRGRLDPPVPGPVERPFGRVVDAEYRTETFRKGVDFAVTRGEPVYAVAGGSVRFAGWFRGYGRMVILDHGGGFFTVSGHLATLEVAVDDVVRAGDRIGTAGATGSLTGPRLYFEIRRGAEALDPARWLRLLPEG